MATVELADKNISITDFNMLAALIREIQEMYPLAETDGGDAHLPTSVTVTITGELTLSE